MKKQFVPIEIKIILLSEDVRALTDSNPLDQNIEGEDDVW